LLIGTITRSELREAIANNALVPLPVDAGEDALMNGFATAKAGRRSSGAPDRHFCY
jgi:hypothetical protein